MASIVKRKKKYPQNCSHECPYGHDGYVRRYVKKIQNSRGLWFSGG